MTPAGLDLLSTAHDHGGFSGAENVDLFVFFAIGVLAGAHCLGMCGPLVTTYADRISPATNKSSRETLSLFDVQQHLLFNLGRTVSYALLGALFGLLGFLAFGSVDTVSAQGDIIRASVGIVVGIVIIAAGMYYLRGTASIPHSLPVVGRIGTIISGALGARIDRYVTSPGIFGLGAIHGLLPCPILYPAYLYAFVIADPFRGGLALGILGLGTIPMLFAYGTLIGAITTRKRIALHRVLGVAFIVLGYIPLQHGLMLLGIVELPHPPIPYYDPL